MTTYKAWYDKKKGLFTIQDAKGVPVFKRLLVRSGQRGFLNSPWVRQKGAIPTNKQVAGGKLYIHTTSIKDPKGDFNNDGIGLFFPISDSLEQTLQIRGLKDRELREAIGLHPENKWDGSLGCIVLVWWKSKARIEKLFSWLQELNKQGVKAIELEVF
jgi:hypothetical protein